MAIQDFVGGSFIGKMGAVVGCRWKDKKCLKTWSKPHNPRTERQQKNRKKFSQCILASQLANQMDFRAIPFQSEENTVWGLRVHTALVNWKQDCYPLFYVPLLQDGQTAGIVISPSFTIAGRKITCSFLSDKDVAGVTLSVMIFEPSGTFPNGEYYLYQVPIQKEQSGYSFSITVSDEILRLSECVICATSYNEMSIAEKILLKTRFLVEPQL